MAKKELGETRKRIKELRERIVKLGYLTDPDGDIPWLQSMLNEEIKREKELVENEVK